MALIKQVETEVLRVFQEEIPSIHFSDKSTREYEDWTSDAVTTFRDGLHLPPEIFKGKTLVDFGAGTGENTIQFANWGAECTLVEMNEIALEIAKDVFKKYASGSYTHRFIHSSIFQFQDSRCYDFVCARGSLHHTNEKERAFGIIANRLKPGGFLILGMSSPVGGFQNNLQRMICFQFGKTRQEIVEIAECLFKEDIDRAERFSKRTRRSIIFDRWVVPKQDDPTVQDVLGWFRKNGLRFYHSHPSILPPVLADSTHHRPKFRVDSIEAIGAFAEAFWLSHRDSDEMEVSEIVEGLDEFAASQSELAYAVNNVEPSTCVDIDDLEQKIDDHLSALGQFSLTQHILRRHTGLFAEVKALLVLMRKNDLDGISHFLRSTVYLFRGMNGLRSVNYVGCKI